MNYYEKITKETRKKVSKLTLRQQNELNQLYSDSIKDLSKKAQKSNKRTLTNRWVLDYKKQLEQSKKELRVEISRKTKKSIKDSANIGSEGQQQIMRGIFDKAGINTGEHFTEMLSKVNDNIVKDIISGKLYKDNKTLSQRIWNHSEDFEKDIQYTINQAILEKKSAIELSDDLEKFVRDPAKRPTDWRKAYPKLANRKADYNAIRLARTSINHAYQTATIQATQINPFVEGIEWRSALIHGRTCELCMERDGRIYSVEDVPLDHP